ncbi:hypothetical protein GLAREA_12032 [Glarea lozoyensis ATCC 20868]|uniref:Uncharacterized protein n=1 Tax=Glarea lozoyensis (strain ATCC 20868 / MF5171) TaxID=1116229 RepID=S3D2A4_GLAL2|nr:uncharacterized protein GLAREA_12032 [Glarea lozoyensis ATCC 20868]EPE31950.1 hypothetical protein GLAREA_12032 [Glarea lozoyensis ATCC 20868]
MSFLKIIAGFRNLYDLTIYVQSKLTEHNADLVLEDIDQQSSLNIMTNLVLMKRGLAFTRLRIKVGGWTKYGPSPRRAGSDWRRRRRLGRNPERLFYSEFYEDKAFLREHKYGSGCGWVDVDDLPDWYY